MDWLVFLFVGLIAGVIAKAIMPGSAKEPSGWLLTILLGIAGAYVGGFLGRTLLGASANNFVMHIVFATVGAVVIIGLMRLLTGRRAA